MDNHAAEDQMVALPVMLIRDERANPTARILHQHWECPLGRTVQGNHDSGDFVLVHNPVDDANEAGDTTGEDNIFDRSGDDDDDDSTVEGDDGTENHLIHNESQQGWWVFSTNFLSLTPRHDNHYRLVLVRGISHDAYGNNSSHIASPAFPSGEQTPDSMYPEPSTSSQRSSPESSTLLMPLCPNQVSLLLLMGQQFPNGPLRMTSPPHALDISPDGFPDAEDMNHDM